MFIYEIKLPTVFIMNYLLYIRNFFLIWIQILLISLIWFIADFISKKYLSFIPSGILGLIFLIILLYLKVPLKFFSYGANWMIAQMVLFFIPVVVYIIKFQNIFLKNGFSIIFIIIVSTIMVMICTALVTEFLYKLHIQRKKKKKIYKYK